MKLMTLMMLPRVQWIQRLCAIWGEEADCCSCAHLRFLEKDDDEGYDDDFCHDYADNQLDYAD